MVENWLMTIWSDDRTDLWHGEARRLRATLNAISACVRAHYGEPLTWRSETLDADGWRDIDQLAAHLDSHQLRDDAGKIMKGGGANGTVQGYLGNRPQNMTNMQYGAGSGDATPFHCTVHFYARESERGARPINEHPPAWLAQLLAETAQATGDNISLARIHTNRLSRLLRRARPLATVGALTLAPAAIDTTALPASIAVYPCPNLPDRVVLVASLNEVTTDPESVVADLIAAEDAINQGARG
jgi:hypothetical protein